MLYQNILLKPASLHSEETGRILVLGNGPTYGDMKFTSSHISLFSSHKWAGEGGNTLMRL